MKKILLALVVFGSVLGCTRVPPGQVGIKVYLNGGDKGVDHEVLGEVRQLRELTRGARKSSAPTAVLGHRARAAPARGSTRPTGWAPEAPPAAREARAA